MGLKDKYSELITAARAAKVSGLEIKEENRKLYIEGVAPTEEAKRKLWHLCGRISNDASNDVVLNIKLTHNDGETKDITV